MEPRKKYKTVIVIAGPTAVGKTAAAIRIAQQLDTDIISADSRQCYKELNIGVARPSVQELEAVRHYFIASHSIHGGSGGEQDQAEGGNEVEVNAALFEQLSLGWAEEIFKKKDWVVVVGGTGLYINAFCEGLDNIPAIDPDIRQAVRADYETLGIAGLQASVQEEDPGFFAVGEIHNPQRLMRALEVKRSTGQSILSFRNREKTDRPFRIIKTGLHLPKEILDRHIDRRVDQMMEMGLLEEARGLEPFKALNALRTVGYAELFAFLRGDCSLKEAVADIKTHTRQYAKRQVTWFKKDPAIQWVGAGDLAGLEKITQF